MRVFLCVLLVLAFAVAASAQTNTVRWDFDGTQTLTEAGWTLTRNAGDIVEKSLDYSSGINDGGMLGININDNNYLAPTTNSYMKMYKNPGVDQSRGLVMARIKCISGNNTAGTFGYSSAGGNASAMLGIRTSGINIKSAGGANSSFNGGATVTVPGGTADYKVYALRWKTGGIYDIFVSNGSDWSSNPADWTQLVDDGGWETSPGYLVDENGVGQSGLVLGSFGSSGNTSNVNIDYISWTQNDVFGDPQDPWAFNPQPVVPEPSSLVALASGLFGIAGFAIRKRR